MIAQLTGRLIAKNALSCIIDVGGVGFQVVMSSHTLAGLPGEGETVRVLTHLHVREDELTLYGFSDEYERALFLRLIEVSGVGPKVALSALSSFRPDALVDAIVREDAALISSVPGIGRKTAQRVIIELKDRLGGGPLEIVPAGGAAAPATSEARDALLAMGFSAAEVAQALKGFDGPADDAEALLKHALRRLGGGV